MLYIISVATKLTTGMPPIKNSQAKDGKQTSNIEIVFKVCKVHIQIDILYPVGLVPSGRGPAWHGIKTGRAVPAHQA
jgi:hypothetical protein